MASDIRWAVTFAPDHRSCRSLQFDDIVLLLLQSDLGLIMCGDEFNNSPIFTHPTDLRRLGSNGKDKPHANGAREVPLETGRYLHHHQIIFFLYFNYGSNPPPTGDDGNSSALE